MIRRRESKGAVVVESAFVYPVAITLLIGMVVLGLGVFRYQQVAHLAREAARYAALHSKASDGPKTGQQLLNEVVIPRAVGLASQSFDPPSAPIYDDANTFATVTLKYHWTPEAFFQPITLQSTATAPITN